MDFKASEYRWPFFVGSMLSTSTMVIESLRICDRFGDLGNLGNRSIVPHFDISKNISRHLKSGLDRVRCGRLFPTPRIRETAIP